MKRKNTRSMVLDFVQANGPQRWSDLHKVVLIVSGKKLTDKGYGISYLGYTTPGKSAFYPTSYDKRYLVYSHVDEKYHLMND